MQMQLKCFAKPHVTKEEISMNGVQQVSTERAPNAAILGLVPSDSEGQEFPEITLDPIGTFVKQEMCSCGGSDDNPYP